MARPLSDDKKIEVRDWIRKDPHMSAADIGRRTGVGEMTIARIKKDMTGQSEPDGQPKKSVNLKEQVLLLETELKLERLINKYLRHYAKAVSDEERLETECQYFQARLEIFGDKSALRLSEQQDEEEEDAETGETKETEDDE